MLYGSGLLARAFSKTFSQIGNVCIYAAGVSNSGCSDRHEFEREHQRLTNALQNEIAVDVFVYFGTCSIGDMDTYNSPYVQHKMAMEKLVFAHPRHLVLRLPQLAGRTPNPHTLLNYLYSRISRSEAFSLWRKAKRNIIDVDDIVVVTKNLIADDSMRKIVLNVANPINYPMIDIVNAMETVTGKPGIYDVLERGSEYSIDTSVLLPVYDKVGINFQDGYLHRVITKYYADSSSKRNELERLMKHL
jgi:nucleoside-diphosphate-sugar epimerase